MNQSVIYLRDYSLEERRTNVEQIAKEECRQPDRCDLCGRMANCCREDYRPQGDHKEKEKPPKTGSSIPNLGPAHSSGCHWCRGTALYQFSVSGSTVCTSSSFSCEPKSCPESLSVSSCVLPDCDSAWSSSSVCSSSSKSNESNITNAGIAVAEITSPPIPLARKNRVISSKILVRDLDATAVAPNIAPIRSSPVMNKPVESSRIQLSGIAERSSSFLTIWMMRIATSGAMSPIISKTERAKPYILNIISV